MRFYLAGRELGRRLVGTLELHNRRTWRIVTGSARTMLFLLSLMCGDFENIETTPAFPDSKESVRRDFGESSRG